MPANRSALIIATDQYSDPKLKRLRSPSQDAAALARVLENPRIGNFNVQLALNQTETAIRRKLSPFFTTAALEDMLLLHVACHGVKDDDGTLYFATTDTDTSDLYATAVRADSIRELMARSRSRHILLLLDCCYSGAFARGRRSRGDPSVGVIEGLSGRGTAVLTASSATEYAWEGDDLSGEGMPSVFTGAVVRGLETGEADRDGDGKISIDELYEYVLEKVREATPKQTPNKQSQVMGEFFIAQSVLGPRSTLRSTEPAGDATPLTRRDFVQKVLVGGMLTSLVATSGWLVWQREEQNRAISELHKQLDDLAGQSGQQAASVLEVPTAQPTVITPTAGTTAVVTPAALTTPAGPQATAIPTGVVAIPAPAVAASTYLSAPESWTPTFSPNFWRGRSGAAPIALVLHTLIGTAAAARQLFAQATGQASIHVLVALDGRIDYVVHIEDTAWANGVLEPGNRWGEVLAAEQVPAGINPNYLTVSVSTEDNGNASFPVSAAQYSSVLQVCQFVVQQLPPIKWLVRHVDISPVSRSNCPGPRWIDSGRFATLAAELDLNTLSG